MSKTCAYSVTSNIERQSGFLLHLSFFFFKLLFFLFSYSCLHFCYIFLGARIATLPSKGYTICVSSPMHWCMGVWFLHTLLVTVKKKISLRVQNQNKMMIPSVDLEKRK